jgi:Flp pilus assembly protein TadG
VALTSHASKRQRGAAAVELAILLPVVLLIIGGIVDFGRFFFTKIELTNAAREGARAAVVTGTPIAGITSRVTAAVPGINPTNLSIGAGACASNATTNVTVAVSMPTFGWFILKPAMNMVRAGSNLPSSVEAKAVMRCGG